MANTKKNEKYEKALFIQRIVAFFIDVVLVTIVASFLILPVTNSESLEKLDTQSMNIMNEYLEGKMDALTYMNQSMDISYDIAKQNGLGTIITIVVYILYYVVFQFYNKGKTVGKQLMRIQVISKDKNELTLNQLLFRSFIINSILVDTLVLLFTIFGSKNIYMGSVFIFMGLQYLIMIASVIMVIYRRDGCGIHDLVAHTEVIRSTIKEKELEVCES